MVGVFRVTPLPGDRKPVTAFAGPSTGAAQAVAVAARVLGLPPSMPVRVDRQAEGSCEWKRVYTLTVAAARGVEAG